jgi:hypothetical protein
MGAKRKNSLYQEAFELSYDHSALTADLTVKLFKVPAGRKLRIDAVDYINPAGLAEDAANYFNLQLKNGSTVIGNWSTETGQEGTLTADTFVAFDMSDTDADLVLDPTEILSIVFDETGTATLPAGRLVVRGRWVQ